MRSCDDPDPEDPTSGRGIPSSRNHGIRKVILRDRGDPLKTRTRPLGTRSVALSSRHADRRALEPEAWDSPVLRRSVLGRGLRLAFCVIGAGFGVARRGRAETGSSAWDSTDAEKASARIAGPGVVRSRFPDPGEKALLESEFAYVSPLLGDGRESRCHGEVWYGWLDDAVVIITAKSTWKARALDRGLDRARIWVGNHGRWKGWFRNNEAFRQAPHFDVRGKRARDPALFERLMAVYAKKYPAEFPDWEERQRSGFASGERLLIRYSTVEEAVTTRSTSSRIEAFA